MYKFKDWIDTEKLDWFWVSKLDKIDFLLDKYIDKINWKIVSRYSKNIILYHVASHFDFNNLVASKADKSLVSIK